MAQKPMYYTVEQKHVTVFNTADRTELGFVGGEYNKDEHTYDSGYIVTQGRKFGMSKTEVINEARTAVTELGTKNAKNAYYISGVGVSTEGKLTISETKLPNPEVDTNNNSFVISGTTYILGVDSDGKISISTFKALQIKTLTIPAATPSGNVTNKVIEYDDSYSYTMSLKPSNEAAFTLDLGTEVIDTNVETGSYIELWRAADEGPGVYSYRTSITSELSQSISIPSTEQAYAPTVTKYYTLNKTSTGVTSDATKKQSVRLHIKTKPKTEGDPIHYYDNTVDINATTIKSTATIKYRFKWSNQEINTDNFKNGTAGTDYQLYSGSASDKPKSLSLNTGGHYYFAYPATWGTPTLAYKGNTDTNWKLDSTTKFYSTEGVEDSGIDYNIYKHQVDQEAGIPMEWTITWA